MKNSFIRVIRLTIPPLLLSLRRWTADDADEMSFIRAHPRHPRFFLPDGVR